MTREAFVDERVVRREQVHDAAVFAHDAGEKQFCFPLEGQPQIVVEVRKLVGVGMDAVQVPQMQPLAREILRHRVRARVGQHPTSLFFKDCGFVEAVAGRQIDQRVVRNAAPEEKRQPRGEFDIADSCGVAVLADRPRRGTRTSDSPTGAAAPVECRFQTCPFGGLLYRKEAEAPDRPPSPAAGTHAARAWRESSGRRPLPDAGFSGLQMKMRRRLGVSPGAARQEGSEHSQGFDVRPAGGVVGVGVAAVEGTQSVRAFADLPHERGGHFARTGLNGDAHAQPRVGGVRLFRDGSGAPGFDVAADGFQEQALAIHRDLQLMRMFEPANTIQIGAKQPDAEFVFPVEWKVVVGASNRRPCPAAFLHDRCPGTDRRER